MDLLSQQFLFTIFAGSIGALVGAAASGLITYRLTKIQFTRLQRERLQLERHAEQALLEVLQGDLKALQVLHSQVATILTELPENAPLNAYIPVTLNYFSVFENNVTQLGRIKSSDLRANIIFVYQHAKSLIDSLRRNNDVLTELQRWEIDLKQKHSEVAQEQFNRRSKFLNLYGGRLKKDSGLLTEQIHRSLDLIDRELRSEA